MFSAPTRRAMLALAAGDLEGTQADRDAFARFLGSMCGGPSVLTKAAEAARLGVTLASVEAYEGGRRVRVAI